MERLLKNWLVPLFFVLAVTLLLSGLSYGATYYVRDQSGEYGAEDGTSIATAFDGWSDVSGVTGGDVLVVYGTVAESGANVSMPQEGVTGFPITVYGGHPDAPGTIALSNTRMLVSQEHYIYKNLTITQADSSKRVVWGANDEYVTWSDVTFVGGKYGVRWDENVLAPKHWNFIDCTFKEMTYAGIYVHVPDADAWSLEDFTVSGGSFFQIGGIESGGKGIEIRGDWDAANMILSGATIIDTVFEQCDEHAVKLWGSGVTPGFEWSAIDIQRNTVLDGGGGFSIMGFGASSWGENNVSYNTVSGTSDTTGGANIFCSQYVSVEYNLFEDMQTGTVDGNAVTIDYGNQNLRVRWNKIRDIRGKSGVANSGYAVMILDSRDVEVYGNESVGTLNGVLLGDEDLAPFAGVVPSGVSVWQNTWALCSDRGLLLAVSLGADDVVQAWFENNIFTGDGSGTGVQNGVGTDTNWDYNLLEDFSTDYDTQTAGSNDVTADPLFVDTGATNYNLQSGSPACQVGKVLTGVATSEDLDGNVIPQYGSYDLGARPFTGKIVVAPSGTSTFPYNNPNLGVTDLGTAEDWAEISNQTIRIKRGDYTNYKVETIPKRMINMPGARYE